MISVKKDFNDIPESLRKKSPPTKAPKNCHFKADVKTKLNGIYNGKCAYCESKSTLEVEHYRPKSEVYEDRKHPGYFWLAYEWSNLLYACHDCNSLSKKTQFPLNTDGKRVYSYHGDRSQCNLTSDELLNEKPLLLNPEIDKPEIEKPEACIEFLPDGSVGAINGSRRGEETIKICSLNRDILLLSERKTIIDDIMRDCLNNSVVLYEDFFVKEGTIETKHYRLAFKSTFEKIKNGMKPDHRFSRLYVYIYEKFNEFLEECTEIKKVEHFWKQLIKDAFAMFKQGEL